MKVRTRTCRVGRSNKGNGFTLLELVVVMLILTAVLGLVVPEVSSVFLRSDLKASSRRLAGAVAYARSQAMVEGRLWELTLDLDESTFWTDPAIGGTGDSEESDLEEDTAKKRSLEGEVRFLDIQKLPDEPRNTGQVTLRFQPKGLVEPALIHLAGPGNKVQTLFIKPFNGRVVVRDGYMEGRDEEIG
ncbi:MAG: GspH/FimT family pseudopilin [Deltaproteobacteria bacterium]|nr:MAG: GspH/FimT family pseudopilin [Deltaproteobacteria bacterium]